MLEYRTIKIDTTAIFKDRGSKFIAFAYFVGQESDAKNKISQLKKQLSDASHHCYAYKIEDIIAKSSDDREPQNTAGKPILNQIEVNKLTNILIVVVRYFGGTLLGKYGLIKAYSEAAKEAINKAEIITKKLSKNLTIKFDYEQTKNINKIINNSEIEELEKNFADKCSISVAIPVDKFDEVSEKLKNIGDVEM